MKKEDMMKAATLYADDVCKGPRYRWGHEQFAMVDFIEGAKWRINSALHDASEKYEIRLPSVVVFKNGRADVYLDLRDVTYDGLWDEVKEYAYLKDLRPNRKEDER